MARQNQNTMYDHMDFPKVEFQEFPMAVPVVDGVVQPTPYDERRKPHPVVMVNSQEELDALKGPGVTLVQVNPNVVEGGPQRLENEEDIRNALYLQAEQAVVTIDKRWSVARIEDTLKAAQDAKDAKSGKGDVV